MIEFAQIKSRALKAIEDIQDEKALEDLRVEYFGKKGILVQFLQELEQLPPKEKPIMGKAINELKKEILANLEAKSLLMQEKALSLKLEQEKIDVSLPGRNQDAGSLHPVTHLRRKIEAYFKTLGFDIISGPEVETEFYNFEALNIPAWHPARAMHDTFYFDEDMLLRTHTSPVQIRSMLEGCAPFRLIAPGRVYRCDYDVTHTPMFHQVEGLMIDKDITLAGLKSIFLDLFKFLFAKDIELRFRPSYFPFTEPSAELDIACTNCDGIGCRSCKFTGWLEVLGCGMVHPYVLNTVNVETQYQGWAFGMGIDRIAMLYYGIDDLRTLFENDVKFLRQF